MTRYHSGGAQGRSAKGRALRGFGWFLLLALVVGAGIGGGTYVYAKMTLHGLTGGKPGDKHAVTRLKLVQPGHAAVALIAGYDHRAGDGSSYAGSNSDTLMLMRADPVTHTLSLLSFPRDLNVPIYCHGDTVATHDRINSAWSLCGGNGGPRGALDTIEHLTGVPINFLITLDFRAFKQVVNRLHGVYINVDRRYFIAPNTGTSAINLHPGYQKLDGGQALSYVRFRHYDSDIYRNGRQQIFLQALKSRVRQEISLSNILSIPPLIGALSGNLAISQAGGGDISPNVLITYLDLLQTLPPGHLIRNAIPTADIQYVMIGGASEVEASPQAIAGAVHNFLHPKVPVAHKPKKHGGKKTPKLPHKTVSVLVLNGGNITGEAANTSYLLHKQQFVVKKLPASTPANAPSKTHDTIVYYNPSQANGQKAAEVLAPLFGPHTHIAQMTPTIATIATKAGDPLTVAAVGTAYKGKLKLPHTAGPTHSQTANAHVISGIPATLSAIRSQNGPAHFTLMVPHKIAAGSSISTLPESVRLFHPLRGKQELVLTYYQPVGPGEYWQIEESNWTTELLLQHPTKTFTYKGRKYAEFTSGGAIQTIALYYGKNVYWVQNTILNSLSNATMLAIAEGLQPLH